MRPRRLGRIILSLSAGSRRYRYWTSSGCRIHHRRARWRDLSRTSLRTGTKDDYRKEEDWDNSTQVTSATIRSYCNVVHGNALACINIFFEAVRRVTHTSHPKQNPG